MGSRESPSVFPWSAGLPNNVKEEFITIPWNDLELLKQTMTLLFSDCAFWLLHFDWWRASDKEENVNNMKPLLVYVGNNADNIYDVLGKKRIVSFSNSYRYNYPDKFIVSLISFSSSDLSNRAFHF